MNIVVVGPTASGKTQLAIEISKLFNSIRIVNVDSRQFWPLRIITASPTEEELQQAPHVLFNCFEAKRISLALWCSCLKEMNDELKVIVGGNGFYINSLRKGVPKYTALNNVEYSFEDLIELARNVSGVKITSNQVEIDGVIIHRNDKYRVQQQANFLFNTKSTYNNYADRYTEEMFIISVIPDWNTLSERIERRADKILPSAIEEIKSIKHSDVYDSVIGYKEIRQYLRDEITYSFLRDNLILKTKKYAKKQIKFIKKIPAHLQITSHILNNETSAMIYTSLASYMKDSF